MDRRELINDFLGVISSHAEGKGLTQFSLGAEDSVHVLDSLVTIYSIFLSEFVKNIPESDREGVLNEFLEMMRAELKEKVNIACRYKKEDEDEEDI